MILKWIFLTQRWDPKRYYNSTVVENEGSYIFDANIQIKLTSIF